MDAPTPTLFGTPDRLVVAARKNILRRSAIPLTRDEWEDTMDRVSPARHLLRDEVTEALEKYAYNVVGPIYFPYECIEQRDHFLPHTGLWLDRPFADPRVQTQIWMHTAFHEWYGWPLPAATTFDRYCRAAYVGELHATMESEYGLFERFPEQTEGMFNPAYPSTYEAFRAVGAKTQDEAFQLAHHAQFHGGHFPTEVYRHPNFRGGVAVTLHRQSAWAEHDEAYNTLYWKYQHHPEFDHVYRTFWTPDRQEAIFARQKLGREGLLAWSRQHKYDDEAHLRAVAKSMLRVMVLELVERPCWKSYRNNAEAQFRAILMGEKRLLQDMVALLPERYGAELGAVDTPMPLWSLAMQFRDFRVKWEERLKERTAAWVQVQEDRTAS